MSVTWIKTSVALSLTLLTTVFHTSPVEAGGFGRFVVGQVINHSPRAQMIAGTVAPIVQTAQMQGGRLSPGQIVQAVSDGRNLVQQLRSTGPQMPMDQGVPMEQGISFPQEQLSSFPGMPAQCGSVQSVSYSEPVYQQAPPQDPAPQYSAPQQGPGPGPQGPGPQLGNAPVDLVVENITFAEPATKIVGPAYKIQVRNQGSQPAAKFHIGLFASLDGKVNEQSPKAFLEVLDLAPNTVMEYTIRLPKSADKMIDPATKETKPFTFVATAVDFFGTQPEGDETNNTAVLPRDEVDGAIKVAAADPAPVAAPAPAVEAE